MRTSTRRLTPAVGALALGLAGLLTLACDTVPLTAPSASTVTLTAAALVLPTGGSTQVTATVFEPGGTPVQNGTSVRFTTTLGRVDPVEVQTRNGVATAMFMAGDASGLADVRATSGPAGGATSGTGATATATNQVQITVGAAAVETVTVRSSAGSVPATGGSVDIIATVISKDARPLPGVPVSFTTTSGTLSHSRETTDGNGEASTRLTTDATAIVTATAGTKTSPGVTITALNPVLTPTVTLTATPGEPTALAQLVTFVAAVTDAQAFGTPVQFEWNFGDGTSAQGTSPNISHAYTQGSKIFTATVTVRFANGRVLSAQADVVTKPFPLAAASRIDR